MRAYRDPDLLLVERMVAPPPLADARRSLAYWQRRRETLPLYRRAARREAKEMAIRWQARVRAAQQVRFESSLLGRLLTAIGISSSWMVRLRFGERRFLRLAWVFVPPKVKLVAGAIVATWLIVVAAAVAVVVFVIAQLP